MTTTCLLPNLQHWLDPYVAHRLQQLCRSCVCAPISVGDSPLLTAKLHGHLPALWRRPQSGRYTSRTRVSCIKPGSKPDDVVKRIDRDDVTISFARSGGAGGQNVNKVNTKVDMRLNVDTAHWLADDIRDALQRLEKNRINKDGELVITSTDSRSQSDNIEDALEKMQRAVDRAAQSVIPNEVDPAKIKKIAKQAKISNENRLKKKKAKSDKKGARRSRIDFD